jgi:Xaa-Pro aminopeptidase
MKMLDASEYPKRRQELMNRIGENSAIILASGAEQTRNADTHYRFRVDSDFYYLTGFDEPEAVFIVRPGLDCGASVLFCQDRDPLLEQWEGTRLGTERAPSELSIAKAYSIKDIDEIMPTLIDGVENLHFPIGRYAWLDKAVGRWQRTLKSRERKGSRAPLNWSDIDRILHTMRRIKSHAEFEQMWAVAEITASAHRNAMSIARPGCWEYELDAVIQHEFMKHGCQSAAYPTIVAGGVNANILHYIRNNQRIADGELVLIDAGGELDYYAADVTRTFPVNGRFSEPQKRVYNIVLDAQLKAIDSIKPGVPYDLYHNVATKVLIEGLQSLGMLSGTVEEILESGSYKRFYMHRTGHYLGMDVHDVGSYKDGSEWVKLKSGMVVTVEPGLYIPSDDDIPEEYRGIGIRIEDDIVVTEQGSNNLTYAAPKTIEEIETWMAEGKEKRES